MQTCLPDRFQNGSMGEVRCGNHKYVNLAGGQEIPVIFKNGNFFAGLLVTLERR